MLLTHSVFQARAQALTIVSDGWAALGIWFLIGMLRTNRIRSREPVWKRTLDAGALVLGFVLLFGPSPWRVLHADIVPQHNAQIWTGAVVALLGLGLTLWARLVLGRYWSAVVAEKEDHRLIQSGPYALVRHPLYSGLLLAVLGSAVVLDHWSSLLGIAVLLAAYLRRAHQEDTIMAARFGDEFSAYRSRTGLIVPGWG